MGCIRHSGKCKGDIVVNLANLFDIISPGLSITSTGIKVSVSEVRPKPGRVQINLSCRKCGEEINPETENPKIECQCFICKEYKNISVMKTSTNIPPVCDSCIKVLKKEAEPTNDKIRVLSSYIVLPGEDFKFVPLMEVIKIIKI